MGLISYRDETVNLAKRANGNNTGKFVNSYYSYGSSSSWQSQRWILFVIVVAVVLLIVLYTFLVNRRRQRTGRAPIRGTAWLTPPSYGQSQQQYTGNVQQHTNDYVPEYTERANEHDLGYYDERGEFHPNDKAACLSSPPLVQECSSEFDSSLERPPAAVVHQTSPSDMVNDVTRPNIGQVPVAGDAAEQLEGFSEVNGTQQITPPERAKTNSK
ncbi:hypothetical protein SKDZ_02G1120 [Saccharomyces kudriavzevii ZP591]|nr:hypothetical protein SKDZ_02G1120 [Saccharomyces kudriavzevii ZP591]